MAGQVFIAYSHRDDRYAEALTSALRRFGIDVWTDTAIELGSNWARMIERQVREAAAIVVIMTPAAEESVWVERELALAQSLSKPILPILLEGRPFLAVHDVLYEDARGGNLPAPDFFAQLRRMIDAAPTRPVPPRLPDDVPGLVRSDATKVFISYRRGDSAFAAHWLHSALVTWFEQDGALRADSFFIDVDSINPGRRFRDAVDEAIQQCQVLLVLIGDRWLTAEAGGLRRLDAPNDMVRQEVELGLKNGVTIVPVMFAPAVMPDARLLPDSIQELTEFQGLTIAPERFEEAARFLAPKLKEIIGL